MGQLDSALTVREKGALPTQTEVNPRNQEQVKAITLKNGREMESAPKSKIPKIAQNSKTAPSDETTKISKAPPVAPSKLFPEPMKAYVPPIPFPQRLKKDKKDN